MKLVFHKKFVKAYKRLGGGERNKADECLKMFASNPFLPLLNNHPLSGRYEGYRSINITGDVRALYQRQSDDVALFVTIGTHSSLYR